MRYISTRGQSEPVDFQQALLTGLAPDGGLYVPEAFPTLDHDALRDLRGRGYAEVAFRVIQPFVGEAVGEDDLRRILDDAYRQFDHHLVAPLVQIEPDHWLMELWHGPTLAFKDIAMQVLGRLYDHVLRQRDAHVTLIGATSGDTGSAAIEAVRHCERASIFILHPHNRTSEVQRRQMTTVEAPNVHNLAVEGTFDDCQNLVKAMFNDPVFRGAVNLSGVNSINWARICPQIVYYFTAALALGAPDRPVRFSVPTGNFGDIYAGYVAKCMGLPIDRLIIASNVNDILTRALRAGDHSLSDVVRTSSPSMDIQISSNFERLLFDLFDRDAGRIRELMEGLKQQGGFRIPESPLHRLREQFAAYRVDEPDTARIITRTFQQTREVVDPHTAVGIGAAQQHRRHLESRGESQVARALPTVTLATAHPAKFPDAVEDAMGERPALPARLGDLFDRAEQFEIVPDDLPRLQQLIRDRRSATA